ncbi:MAG: 50S ribosomal protein L16 [Candidatus Altiarchaeota archaeon]
MAKGIRPGRCYRWDSPAFTRVSNNPADSFVTGIPGSKITKYDMGNISGEFDSALSIAVKYDIIIRHNSLEAARVVVQKELEKVLGPANYHFKVNVYPHHIIRENVMATGAGADRVQDGMRKSFGKPIGRAARVCKGQAVFTITSNYTEDKFGKIKKALKSAAQKLPGDYVFVEKRGVAS